MITESLPDARPRRTTKTQLRAQIAAAARCLRHARGAVDRGDLQSAEMWVHFSAKDLHAVETLLTGRS